MEIPGRKGRKVFSVVFVIDREKCSYFISVSKLKKGLKVLVQSASLILFVFTVFYSLMKNDFGLPQTGQT